jgi:hypothetical protein
MPQRELATGEAARPQGHPRGPLVPPEWPGGGGIRQWARTPDAVTDRKTKGYAPLIIEAIFIPHNVLRPRPRRRAFTSMPCGCLHQQHHGAEGTANRERHAPGSSFLDEAWPQNMQYTWQRWSCMLSDLPGVAPLLPMGLQVSGVRWTQGMLQLRMYMCGRAVLLWRG